MDSVHQKVVLFSAFEPSGDKLAAPVIRQLIQRVPGIAVYAFGGAEMEKAGATLIENCIDRSVIGLGALAQVRAHLARLKRLRSWLAANEVHVHVPVDSPAANWSVCGTIRKHMPNARIVHLVLPQIWAWAGWRIRKLRRLTDHVMCILPFEPAWLERRGVRGTFVGHPIFDDLRDRNLQALTDSFESADALRVAVLPGSRHGEIRSNWPTILRAATILRESYDDIAFATSAVHDEARTQMLDVAVEHGFGALFDEMTVRVGETDAEISCVNSLCSPYKPHCTVLAWRATRRMGS